MRDSFLFYRSFFESIEQLPKKEQLEVYKAVVNYALNDVEAELKGVAGIIYSMAKPNIDSNNRKYKKGCTGGRPKDDDSPLMKLPDIDCVNITESQYKRACEKFGETVTDKAITILDSWLARGGKTQQQYIGKNHYGFFKSDNWIIKNAQEELKSGMPNWSV